MKTKDLKIMLKNAKKFTGKGVKVVKLTGINQLLTIKATNLEEALLFNLQQKQVGQFEAVVSLDTLSKVINNIKASDIELRVRDGRLIVEADKAEIRIQTWPLESFPQTPIGRDLEEVVEVDVDVLAKPLAFAAKKEEKYLPGKLAGVYFEKQGNKLTLTATNSMYLYNNTIKTNQGKDCNILVPAAFIKKIKALAKAVKVDKVKIYNIKSGAGFNIAVRVGKHLAVCYQYDDEYPEYEKLFFRQADVHVCVDAGELSGVLTRHSIATLKVRDDKIIVTMQDKDVEITREVACKSDTQFDVILRADFLENCLKVGGDITTINENMETGQTYLNPIQFKNGNERALLMPRRG